MSLLTDIWGGVKNIVGGVFGGGGKATIAAPQNTVEVPFIQQGGKISIPGLSGASTPSFITTKPPTGSSYYNPQDVTYKGTFPVPNPGAQPVSSTWTDVRPLITTPNPIITGTTETTPKEESIYVAPGQSGAYQSTEQKAQSQAQKIAQQQAVINQQVQQDRASQVSGPSIGGSGGGVSNSPSGFGVSGTIIGPSATQGILNNQANQDEINKKKPQFKGLVSLDQARQMGLTGAGQSGVFKDQQGDFYGINNAQVANTFTPNATGKLDVTQNVVGTVAPFQTSLATGPVYADQLSGAGKLTKAPIEWYKDLQTAVDNSLANQPPVPTQPVVETANQQAFVKNSSDPYGLQAAMDASRLKNGLPDLEKQRIQTMQNIQALNEGLQKIVKDINDNPDYPKSLAARLITDFSNKNAITLQNLQSQLQITNTQIDQANSAVDREFGIAEKNLTLQQNQQDQQKADVKNQLNTLISSGAIGEMSDSELSQWASATGYTLSSLQAIKKAKTTSEDKYDSTYTNDEGNDLVFYGVNKKTGIVEEIKRVKGGATPKATTSDTTFSDKVIDGRLTRVLSDKKTGEVISKTDLGSAGETSTSDKKGLFLQYLSTIAPNTKTKAELKQEALAAGLNPEDTDIVGAMGNINTISSLGKFFGINY